MIASRLSDSMYCLSFLPTLSCLFARYCCSSVAGMVGPVLVSQVAQVNSHTQVGCRRLVLCQLSVLWVFFVVFLVQVPDSNNIFIMVAAGFFFWLADNYHLFCVVSSVVIIAPPHSGMIGKRSCSPRSRGYSLLFLVPDSNIIMVASGLADNFHLFCVVFFGRNHCLTQVVSGNVLGLQGRALGL